MEQKKCQHVFNIEHYVEYLCRGLLGKSNPGKMSLEWKKSMVM